MARTQAADYGERRLGIIEAAADLYAERGFLGASLADLAESCGSSKSLIYHYFSSKEDILFEVMASHIDDLNAAADEVAASNAEPVAKLRALTRAFMGLYVGAASRHKVLLNDLDHLPAARRREIVTRQRRLVELVESWLQALMPDLGRSRQVLRPTAMLYFGMINWTHTWFDPKGGATAEQIADMAVDMVLSGLPAVAKR